ncbi:MAG: alpha/beta hydrolase [Oscillatoria princeps RMCB-10]|jgi:predicted dienelactone hydrolase|nr:alpha/beta hydrolase [Oscillatoria princeps RMCB-10]
MRSSLKGLSRIAGFLCAIAITQLGGVRAPAQAAETVVIRFGPLAESISVADLRTVADTGTVPDALDGYARRLSSQQRSAVLGALRVKVPLGVVTVSKLLNTRIGTAILSDLAAVTPRRDTAGVQALRAALVLGAKAPEGLSVLNFIEAYPSQRLNIDLGKAFEVMGNLNTSFWQTQRFMAAIAPQLAPQKPALTLPFDPSKPGPAEVRVLTLTLNDSQRQRTIPVDIYWSAAATSAKPVAVFSHGMGSVRSDMRYLAEHLASHGYVAVALEHPGSNQTQVDLAAAGKGPGIQPQEFLERPKDISFVLDELEKLNKTAGPLQGKLAADRVMAVGYSMGGGTVLSAAGGELQLAGLKQRCQRNLVALSLGEGLQCVAGGLPEDRYRLGDPRIKSAVALNPTTSLLFGETGLSQVRVPVLMVAGSADKTTPAIAEQIAGFAKLPSPKWLAGVIGGTHLSVKDPSTTGDQARRASTALTGGEVVGEQAADIRNYVKATVLAMAAQMTSDAAQYGIFLTPEYAQYASTPAFPVRLATEIPSQTQAALKAFIQSQPR